MLKKTPLPSQGPFVPFSQSICIFECQLRASMIFSFPAFIKSVIKNLVKGIYLAVCSVLFIACWGKSERKDYVNWVTSYENGLHVSKTFEGYSFDLQYQPAEFVLLQRGVDNLTLLQRTDELEKISSIQYYTLKISREDKADLGEYGVTNITEKQQRDYYFSYNFQNDIYLEEGDTLLPCVLYHFERLETQNGGRTFVLGFENLNKNLTEARLSIQSELFSSLPIKIQLNKSDIPQVEL